MVPSSAICAPGGPFGPPAPLSGEALSGPYVDNKWVQIDHIPFQHMDSRAPESLALDISLANPAVLHALPCVHDDIPKGSPDSWVIERTRGLQPDTTNIKMDTSCLFFAWRSRPKYLLSRSYPCAQLGHLPSWVSKMEGFGDASLKEEKQGTNDFSSLLNKLPYDISSTECVPDC